jgi:hypothetical protein
MTTTAKAGKTRGEHIRGQIAEHWLEILATFVLTFGSVVAAWSANQAALWGSDQASSYTSAGAKRTEATRAENRAGILAQIDNATFDNYAEAVNAGDQQLASFYERRFRPEFRPAFDAWLATKPRQNPNAPPSPLEMPEYQLADAKLSADLTNQAEALFKRGETANLNGRLYATNSFLTALALFFAGLAPRFTWRPLKIVVVVLALLMLLWAVGNAALYPRHPETLEWWRP